MSAFGELWRRHEELTRDYAKLLHDDAGQVLTAIALRLSSLEVTAESRAEVRELQSILDELLERFRRAQASLGAAVVAKRGLAAGLSQLARHRENLEIRAGEGPKWPLESALAAFRIIEALEPKAVMVAADRVVAAGGKKPGPYHEELAVQGNLRIRTGAEGITISIQHDD
jgi:hypothetical protein